MYEIVHHNILFIHLMIINIIQYLHFFLNLIRNISVQWSQTEMGVFAGEYLNHDEFKFQFKWQNDWTFQRSFLIFPNFHGISRIFNRTFELPILVLELWLNSKLIVGRLRGPSPPLMFSVIFKKKNTVLMR